MADTKAKLDTRAKFVELAMQRVSKTLHSIRNVKRLANKRAYNFTEPDVNKIFKALGDELKAAHDAFQAALKGVAQVKQTEFTL